ncbi:MAG: hypothetical protein KBC73_21385 [Burkholderiaceae bacterium]|nr:hypothetical protein [Burkholderiaceae bacterium]
MPSFVWSRDPSEAFREPYEYGGQEQFAREAVAVITHLTKHYDTADSRFPISDASRRRAVWMLQVDALSALSDAVELLEEKRFRVVSRLFRDVVETLDASFYSDLSKYAHRTFRALSMSYLLGRGETAIYDGFKPKASFHVLPHVISFAYAMLAGLIKRFVRFAVDTGQLTAAAEAALWEACLEPETAPRRFGVGPGQLMCGPEMPIDEA